jgi:radical SAM protein with 4Fe4S-binding SPASM domain
VFSESRCQFVGDYFDGIVLSFDGFAEFHNRNRPAKGGGPTFEQVERTANRLSTMPLDLCLRVCITADSVSSMEAITTWMCSTFHPTVINFETLTPGELAASAGLRVPDPYEFAVNCVQSYRAAARAGVKAVYSAAETERNRISFCPVGTDALIVSMDGRASACYLMPEDWQRRGLDLDLGWVRPDGSLDLDFERLFAARRLPVQKPRCERCFCQWSCAGGCHVNQTYPGCDADFTDFCLQTRIITACLLLDEIGANDVVDRLLASRTAMEAVAHHSWDPVALSAMPDAPWPDVAGGTPSSASPAGRIGSLVASGTALLG